MPSNYVEQPILGSGEIAAFLKKVGLNFAAWPQSVLPEEMLRSLDAGTEADIEMLVRNDADLGGTPEQYRAKLLNENRMPRGILRTSWGLLIGEKMEAGEANGVDFVRYSVEVHCARAWNDPALQSYCEACMELLSESVSSFMERNRKIEIDLDDAAGDGLVHLSVFISRKEQPEMESEAADGLCRYLIEIFEDGTMDRVIEAGVPGGIGMPRVPAAMSGA